MLVSHRYKFILFQDPLGESPWIADALQPWLDQVVPLVARKGADLPLARHMSPLETAQTFAESGRDFDAYTRIAIIRNPYSKLAQLYYRIAMKDPVWRFRQQLGCNYPNFGRWLKKTRPNCFGAGFPGGPRWRKFGAWSADAWCGGVVSHTVRASDAARELAEIFDCIGITPAFGNNRIDEFGRSHLKALFDNESRCLVRHRYQTDLAICRHPPLPARDLLGPMRDRPLRNYGLSAA